MTLTSIILSGKKKTGNKKSTCCMTPLMWHSEKDNDKGTKNISMVDKVKG